MKKFLLLFLLTLSSIEGVFEATKNLPVVYEGRIRSADSAARLWLYDISHTQTPKGLKESTALDLLWDLHFFGPSAYMDAPLFWVHPASLKSKLHLDLKQDRFSYNTLKLQSESADLQNKLLSFAQLGPQQNRSNELSLQLQLRAAGNTLKMLPSKYQSGEWFSLHAFDTKVRSKKTNALEPVGNFTLFTNDSFEKIRNSYFDLQSAVLSQQNSKSIASAAEKFALIYTNAYEEIAGNLYAKSEVKSLAFPSISMLKAETFYYNFPLLELAILLYFIGLILLLLKRAQWGLGFVFTGFILHTIVLLIRCFILQRPPVSNMFETVVYVPWVALVTGLIFYFVNKSPILLTAATTTSLGLLVLLKLANLDARMENVQAVLDSQYWLIIHVLMVVGSYGSFFVSGILAHFYLVEYIWRGKNSPNIADGVLHTLYLGICMLIPGTLLGGVWAAESWGRFWDWDPKESWAFISACIYLLVIHSYTFKKVGDLGLAVGSVLGLIAISFTWYGVNYILGTGLHSYGFGSGGELFYFLYIGAEVLFLSAVGTRFFLLPKQEIS